MRTRIADRERGTGTEPTEVHERAAGWLVRQLAWEQRLSELRAHGTRTPEHRAA